MATWKGKGYECEPGDMDHDIKQWGDASSTFSSASKAAGKQATSPPEFGSHFAAVKKAYMEQAKAVDGHCSAGAKEVDKIAGIISSSKAQYEKDQAAAAAAVRNAGNKGGGNGGGQHGGGHNGGGGHNDDDGRKQHKLSEWDDDLEDEGEPKDPQLPGNPNDPKDDKSYNQLEQLVNGLLEQDGTRVNALGTNDMFDGSQETVVAYTDKDGKVHVISTNEGQGHHAQSMTISFIDEHGNAHVVTTVDGKMVESTAGPTGTERRVVMQGSLDQMMAEASEINIAWTDDKGVEHVVSTDKQMEQVVVGYADENGQQHMVTNEKGADFAENHPTEAQQNIAYGQVPGGQDGHWVDHGPTDQGGGNAFAPHDSAQSDAQAPSAQSDAQAASAQSDAQAASAQSDAQAASAQSDDQAVAASDAAPAIGSQAAPVAAADAASSGGGSAQAEPVGGGSAQAEPVGGGSAQAEPGAAGADGGKAEFVAASVDSGAAPTTDVRAESGAPATAAPAQQASFAVSSDAQSSSTATGDSTAAGQVTGDRQSGQGGYAPIGAGGGMGAAGGGHAAPSSHAGAGQLQPPSLGGRTTFVPESLDDDRATPVVVGGSTHQSGARPTKA